MSEVPRGSVVLAETPDGEQDDGALVRRVCQEGDSAAFSALVRRHQGPLRAWLRRLLRAEAQQADDLAQEAFLRVYRNLAAWRGEASFRSWLFRVALSVWQDHHRRPSVWAESLEDPLAPSLPSADTSGAFGPSYTASDGWASRMALSLDIDRALDQLSTVQREVVVHACWADLSHAEIARTLGLPLGTVKTHYRRALAVLAQALK